MENLFSYGTLQLANVQQELFGRLVHTVPDALGGYKKAKIKIRVEYVTGFREEEHVIISYSGNELDIVDGIVLSITEKELKEADEYETDDYKRIEVTLRSGKSAWVYVKNDKK